MSPTSEIKSHKSPAGAGGEGEGSRRPLMGGAKGEQEEGEGEEREALTEDLIQEILGPEDDTQ